MTREEDREREGSDFLAGLAAAAEADLFVAAEFSIKTEHFDALSAMPDSWLCMARTLNRAATILSQQLERDAHLCATASDEEEGNAPPSLISPYLLLVAFSLENLLKALIAQNAAPAPAGGKLQKEFCSHDLCELANRAGLNPDQEVMKLLAGASTYGLHWGRYPTPRRSSDFPTYRMVKVTRVIEVYDRFCAELFAKLSQGSAAAP